MEEMTPDNYTLINFPRVQKSGGGICVMHKKHMKTKCERLLCEQSIECIKASACNFTFLCVYRPPPSNKNFSSHKEFVDKMETLIDEYMSRHDRLVILGDFNLHFDNPKDTYVKRFISILDNHGLTQLVKEKTHKCGHILDWVVSSQSEPCVISNLLVQDEFISDHSSITFNIPMSLIPKEKKVVTSRNIKGIDIEAFKDSINEKFANIDTLYPHLDFTNSIDVILRDVLDQHAPLFSREVPDRNSSPWFTEKVLTAKQHRRAAERKWRKSHLTVDRQVYQQATKDVQDIIRHERATYFTDKISNSRNCKTLFSVVNELCGKDKRNILPSDIPPNILPNAFGSFFKEKIDRIQNNITENCNNQMLQHFNMPEKEYNGTIFEKFNEVTSSEVLSIIASSSPKTCSIDSIPTDLLLKCIDVLLDPITEIINHSLELGKFPDCYKKAIVKPLLKKHNLDPEVLNNYRPVSNLSFISKILEKVVLKQINEHLAENNLLEPFQSAYRENHSTETALLKIFNDLLLCCDKGNMSVLTLLDLSAAFDTIDHSILFSRLSKSFGFSGNVMAWMKSYLKERTQKIVVNGHVSESFMLTCGVPQGSVLGPTLFVMYTAPLASIIKSHAIDHHMYADDTQLYKGVIPHNLPSLFIEFENCFQSINFWMTNNMLKLNGSKTEVLLCGSETNHKRINVSCMNFDDIEICFSNRVKNLGVIFDNSLSMDLQINQLVKCMNFELRRIARLKPYVPNKLVKTLVTSFVLSRLDYCNSLLVGLPNCKINKLQRVQNNAARLVLGREFDGSSNEMLAKLHWLPVRARIEFKIATLCFKCLNESAPSYLKDQISLYTPSRQLRSSDSNVLVIPKTRCKTFGDRAFCKAGPDIWNSLPEDILTLSSIDIFKSRLKTHLFNKYLLND